MCMVEVGVLILVWVGFGWIVVDGEVGGGFGGENCGVGVEI